MSASVGPASEGPQVGYIKSQQDWPQVATISLRLSTDFGVVVTTSTSGCKGAPPNWRRFGPGRWRRESSMAFKQSGGGNAKRPHTLVSGSRPGLTRRKLIVEQWMPIRRASGNVQCATKDMCGRMTPVTRESPVNVATPWSNPKSGPARGASTKITEILRRTSTMKLANSRPTSG